MQDQMLVPRAMTIQDVADKLQVSTRTIRKKLAKGNTVHIMIMTDRSGGAGLG